ncbi:hypothetical protein PV963_05750 [Streptomyces coeruleorubidus]|uniref:hypothetical protein n=1 Tax=Streptomyces coeruleorubidus TaxID=116188 RepID=UPI00237F6DA2|nr:hypothetical protein [Streptomyces coeruleorubidus]WDV49901.1 hypothetical protein PV963_05750 [Streptomyces coeruleorubidus]
METLRHFGPGEDGARAYCEGFPDMSDEDLFELVQADWPFRMPVLKLAEAQAAGGGKAYLYELAWQSPGRGGLLRACHVLDGPLFSAPTMHTSARWRSAPIKPPRPAS